MNVKILNIIIPPIAGIVTVLGILILINMIFQGGSVFHTPDNGFFKYFVPFTLAMAILIQITLVLPFWNKFRSGQKILKLSLIPFTMLIILISGLAFGFVFWEKQFGWTELVATSLTGIIAFAVYWTVNLMILKRFHRTLL